MVSLSTFMPGEALVHLLFLQNLNLAKLHTDKLMIHAPGICSTPEPEFNRFIVYMILLVNGLNEEKKNSLQ